MFSSQEENSNNYSSQGFLAVRVHGLDPGLFLSEGWLGKQIHICMERRPEKWNGEVFPHHCS